jgi:sec-independent protein translocase protein TatA
MAAPVFAILDLGTPDLLIILAIVLLLFGAKKLPELSKSLGSSARELRKGLNGEDEKEKESSNQDTTQS